MINSISASLLADIRLMVKKAMEEIDNNLIMYDLSLNELVQTPNLLLPITFQNANSMIRVDLEFLRNLISNNLLNPTLIVGPAGAGKSILLRLLQRVFLEEPGKLCFIIDADTFVLHRNSAQNIGSQAWISDLVKTHYFSRKMDSFEEKTLTDRVLTNCIFLLDSLDEIAERLSQQEFAIFCRSYLFRSSLVITCRQSFFERSSSTLDVANRDILTWQPATEESLVNFVQAYLSMSHSSTEINALSNHILDLPKRHPALHEVLENPLLLTMLCSLDIDNAGLQPVRICDIYSDFVFFLIDREISSGRTNAKRNSIISALIEVAWSRYSNKDTLQSGNLTHFLDRVSWALPSEHDVVIQELQGNPLLRWIPGDNPRAPIYVRLIHQSFQDYLIALRLYRWLLSETDYGDDFFTYIETPEVTSFIKDFLSEIVCNGDQQATASYRLRSALEEVLARITSCESESDGRLTTFAAGQIAYYLGIVGVEEDKKWLGDIIKTQSVFWVKRAGAIGLAIGGYPKLLEALIDEMQEQISCGNFILARQNIGIELGYYGDQQFDVLDPTCDNGLSTCRKLVDHVCQELSADDLTASNARILVFDLLYLHNHRMASYDSFIAEINVHSNELATILNKMATVSGWTFPEIKMLQDSLLVKNS